MNDTATTLVAMVRDVGRLLNRGSSSRAVLQGCAESIVVHLEAAFARIWIYDAPNEMLDLVASAGMYTHIDGPHAHVPVGKLKIGMIASDRLPHLTNDVQTDPRVSNQQWANDNGIISFAGYPLLVEGELIGVMALFSKKMLGEQTLLCLESIADIVAGFVRRKRFEHEQKRSQAMFDDFAIHSRDVFWIEDLVRHRYDYVSPAIEKVFGITEECLYEDPLAFMQDIHSEDSSRVQEFVKDTRTNPRYAEIDYRLALPGGLTKFIWLRVFPLFDSDGEITRLAGIAHDVTERRESELRVNQFYSTVSHELRTPISSIKGCLSLIQNQLVSPEEAEELIGIAHEDCERLIRLVNDILDLRKIEAGKLPLNIQPIDLGKSINNTIQSISQLAHERNIVLEATLSSELHLEADPDRIVQILTNLIANAIKFCPPNSRVSVSAQRSGSTIRCCVADNGPGIKPDDLSKLFNMFQQLDSADNRQSGGTGLGLAITKALIEKHGGMIGVESQPGQGAAFWFELPCQSFNRHCTD